MVLSSKVALCISGAAAIVSGGFGISYLMKREPKVITLDDESINKLNGSSDKWIKDYEGKNNLVADIVENEAWWHWKHRFTFKPFVKDNQKKSSQLDDHFKEVNIGYSGREAKKENKHTSLNKACADAYGKEKSAVPDGGNLQKNIQEFCSTNKHKSSAKPK